MAQVMVCVWIGGVLIFGVGLARGTVTCSLAIYLCIAFYGTSKIFIYCFLSETGIVVFHLNATDNVYLVEKVHVVWAPTLHAKRFKSTIYIICVITVALYPAVAILLIVGTCESIVFEPASSSPHLAGRNTFLREDGVCIIGIKFFASIPLLSYDL